MRQTISKKQFWLVDHVVIATVGLLGCETSHVTFNMADEGTEATDVDSGLLDPQLSLSDELLLDQDDLGEDQPAVKKTGEEIPNIEEDDPVSF